MNFGLLRLNWRLLYREIWAPLSKTTSAPTDMFIELYRYASTKLEFEPDIEALNDQKLAKEEFKKLPIPNDEKTCVILLEGYYEVLSQFETNIKDTYYLKLKDFIENHNLRYFLTSDCKLRLSLTGLLVSQYATLKRSISARQSRNQCLRELEINVGRLSDDEVERNCIRAASNLLEGIVIDESTNNATTFGRAIDGCENCFPHRALIDSAKKFYKFFSDYPNLRHAGRPAFKIRDLKKDDAVLTISFAVLFASYIAENDSSQMIFSGDF